MEYPKTEIYVGPAGSGKTRMANEVGKGKKVYRATGSGRLVLKNMLKVLSRMRGDEELVIIDDVPALWVTNLLESLFEYRIMINRKHHDSFEIERPRTIIIVDGEYELPEQAVFQRRFEVVRFPDAAPE